MSGSTYRNGFRDFLNRPIPQHFRCSDRLSASVPNRDPDIVQFGGNAAEAAVEGIKKANVGNRLWRWTRVVSRAWYGRREKVDARRGQSIWPDFCETLWVVYNLRAWPGNRAADPIPNDETINSLIS